MLDKYRHVNRVQKNWWQWGHKAREMPEFRKKARQADYVLPAGRQLLAYLHVCN